jgi:RNA polymerase sigma-70 factor (ECF subfamily)
MYGIIPHVTPTVPMDPRMPLSPPADPKLQPGLEFLMAGYQQANEEAASALIRKVSPLLLRYFAAQLAGRAHADDLLQETWMRVHKARHTYRPGEPLLPWIFAIARHTGLDNYRKTRRLESRETQVEELPERPDSPHVASQEIVDVQELLAELPESQREVIVMLKISGMSIEEVARATSASVGSVKQKAHRAYEKLRQVLLKRRGNS